MFNFLGLKPTVFQAFIHSCPPFLNFLGHIIHFYKYVLADLMETYFKPLKTFSSTIAYWQTLEKTCSKQVPRKLSIIFNISTYYFKRFCKLFTNVYLDVLNASNKSIVMCLSIQFSPKKFPTNAKTPCAVLDMHESKFAIVETHFTKIGKAYVYFFFPTKLSNSSWLKVFLKGKTMWRHNCITKFFNQIFWTNGMGKWFFIINKPKFLLKYF